jgi:UDP-N-acetylglucosamine--N-acetylmuramyl-(pentapeptide) pyrophosphoryl-undecaprenol N-acetylglucosamine transferase
LKSLVKLPLAFFGALGLVLKFRPDMAISVGGYAAGPAILAAYFCRVPVAVMEQNALPGITNRILGRLAYRVFAGLPTQAFSAGKVVVVGNPVRASLVGIAQKNYVPGEPLRILVMGGSQGAVAINDAVIEALPAIKALGTEVELVHQTGKRDYQRVFTAYEEAGVKAQVQPFIDDMAEIYKTSHLVVTRSGASSIAELALCGLPSILIPFPYAADNHQEANARILSECGAAMLVLQNELTGTRLIEVIKDFIRHPEKLQTMSERALTQAKPDAVATIVDNIESEVSYV